MHTSGQFAGMFRVSKKLLRHYHEIGLLIPSNIDPSNGYSYYDAPQAERMRKILYLRALNIPLGDIKSLLDIGEDDWPGKIRDQLHLVRAEQRSRSRIEAELIALENRLKNGAALFSPAERKAEFRIRVFHLDAPIYIVGRAIRVTHGSPEHLPAIGAVIDDYFGDDVPSLILDRKEPVMRFGICAELTPGTSEFTYMIGDETLRELSRNELTASTRNYTIPAGDYVCISFSAQDIEAITGPALGEGYERLFSWLGSSVEWESAAFGVAYEVYDDERFEVPSWPEMDVWTPVKRK